MIIGYHASHEQFAPSQLLAYVQQAEKAGFQAIMTSDHIAPWSERQGNSGNNWAWLGAAMATTSLPFGSLALPGGWRYHPMVLAHLVATLAEMFPHRLKWVAVGSGEAMNEALIGRGWPHKQERNERLRAGTEIMRRLWRGETVTAEHPWFAVEQAKLWSLPPSAPTIFGAALTEDTARWLGSWTDGFVTVRKPKPDLQKMVAAFQNEGQGKPMALQVQVSWAATKDEARTIAWDQWRQAAAPPDCLADLRTPQEFDTQTKDIEPGAMDDAIPLITQGEELVELLREYASCGFGEFYIHCVSRDQEGFLRFMAKEVLPAFR